MFRVEWREMLLTHREPRGRRRRRNSLSGVCVCVEPRWRGEEKKRVARSVRFSFNIRRMKYIFLPVSRPGRPLNSATTSRLLFLFIRQTTGGLKGRSHAAKNEPLAVFLFIAASTPHLRQSYTHGSSFQCNTSRKEERRMRGVHHPPVRGAIWTLFSSMKYNTPFNRSSSSSSSSPNSISL